MDAMSIPKIVHVVWGVDPVNAENATSVKRHKGSHKYILKSEYDELDKKFDELQAALDDITGICYGVC